MLYFAFIYNVMNDYDLIYPVDLIQEVCNNTINTYGRAVLLLKPHNSRYAMFEEP